MQHHFPKTLSAYSHSSNQTLQQSPARIITVFMFSLPLRATAQVPELKVKRTKVRKNKIETPTNAHRSVSYTALHACADGCIPCGRKQKAMELKSAPKFPQRKYASFCMSEKSCECPQTSSPKGFHPERREKNNQVMSDRSAKWECGRFVECVRFSGKSEEVSS
jgi:hypothetical protein